MYAGVMESWPKRVRFGPGSVRELPSLMTEFGARRALVVCGRTVAGGDMLARVTAALGERPLQVAFREQDLEGPLERDEAEQGEIDGLRHGARQSGSSGVSERLPSGSAVTIALSTRARSGSETP